MGTNGVAFIQWTEANGTLTGSLTKSYTSLGDPAILQHDTTSFTGVASNGSVTLNFPQGLGTSTSWSGTLSGDTLILSYTASDGSISTLTFHLGSVADYNAALSQLQAAAASAAAQQEAEASAAAAQQYAAASAAAAWQYAAASAAAVQDRLDQAVGMASNQLDTTLNLVAGDVSTAETDASEMPQDAASADDALSTVRSALAQVQQDAAVTPMDGYQQGVVCYDVGSATYYVGSVTYYTDPVRTQGGNEAQEAATARAAVTDVNSAIAALESEMAADPGGRAPDVSPNAARETLKDQMSKLDSIDAQAAAALKSAAASDSTAARLLTQVKQIAVSVGASC